MAASTMMNKLKKIIANPMTGDTIKADIKKIDININVITRLAVWRGVASLAARFALISLRSLI